MIRETILTLCLYGVRNDFSTANSVTAPCSTGLHGRAGLQEFF